MKDIGVAALGGKGWNDFGLKDYGLSGFNDVDLKPGSLQILTISGRPLLVTGKFGQGRTVAFTGFTPAYTEKMWPKPGPESFSSWEDLPIIAPLRYLVDQEFVADPVNKSYFALFMRMIAAARGEECLPKRSAAEVGQCLRLGRSLGTHGSVSLRQSHESSYPCLAESWRELPGRTESHGLEAKISWRSSTHINIFGT